MNFISCTIEYVDYYDERNNPSEVSITKCNFSQYELLKKAAITINMQDHKLNFSIRNCTFSSKGLTCIGARYWDDDPSVKNVSQTQCF